MSGRTPEAFDADAFVVGESREWIRRTIRDAAFDVLTDARVPKPLATAEAVANLTAKRVLERPEPPTAAALRRVAEGLPL